MTTEASGRAFATRDIDRGHARRRWAETKPSFLTTEFYAMIAVINIGHPDIVPMTTLAEMIRSELNADPELIQVGSLPPKMTLVKRPLLERQRNLLHFEPAISLQEGVRRVCSVQGRIAQAEEPQRMRGPMRSPSVEKVAS